MVVIIAAFIVCAAVIGWMQYRYVRMVKHLTGPIADEYIEEEKLPRQLSKDEIAIMENLSSKINAKYRDEISNKEIRYAVLQSQINPHFLYNTLDCIRSEALIGGNREIAEMTECLSRFFRYSISSKGNRVTIEDELKNVKDYFHIQQFRFGDKFDLVVKSELEDMNYAIPKMTIQPLIENAVYHGLESKLEGGVVTIWVKEIREGILITVSDNGCGMSVEELRKMNARLNADSPESRMKSKKGTGIALNNVNSRLKITFGNQYGIVVRSMEGRGTDVEIRMSKRRLEELYES